MKRIWLKQMVVITIALLILLFCGCSYILHGYEWSKTRTTMYKPDAFHYAGQMAVYDNGCIYYVSHETGREGLHSMKPDGSDVQFEFEMPKITRLIAVDEGFIT